jgi:hypothetical protein
MTGRLIAAVRAALAKRDRRHDPAAKVTERSARSALYPPAATIDVAPRTAPSTTHAPELGKAGGARGDCEQEFGEGTQSS